MPGVRAGVVFDPVDVVAEARDGESTRLRVRQRIVVHQPGAPDRMMTVGGSLRLPATGREVLEFVLAAQGFEGRLRDPAQRDDLLGTFPPDDQAALSFALGRSAALPG